jgi:hypothetical protein
MKLVFERFMTIWVCKYGSFSILDKIISLQRYSLVCSNQAIVDVLLPNNTKLHVSGSMENNNISKTKYAYKDFVKSFG